MSGQLSLVILINAQTDEDLSGFSAEQKAAVSAPDRFSSEQLVALGVEQLCASRRPYTPEPAWASAHGILQSLGAEGNTGQLRKNAMP